MRRLAKNKNQVGESRYSLDLFQRMALSGMLVLTLLTFIGANFHAYLWQSSDWLVSTVLPSVVVSLTNAERADISEAPLRRNATLDAAAKLKAEHMAKNQYFSHYAPDGTSPWFWFDQAGYVYAHAGENLAIHFSDSSEVVDAWMKSPTHRANIVGAQYTEIGVGTAKGEYEGYDTVYVVQLFGTPAKALAIAPKPAPAQAVAVAQAVEETPVVTATPSAEKEKVEDTDVLAATDPAPVTPAKTTTKTVATTSTSTPVLASGEKSKPVVTESKTEPVFKKELPIFIPTMIATSSGLVALIEQATTTDKTPIAGMVTKPSALLQIVYTLFGFIVIGLLVGAAVIEVKRDRYLQVAYSLGLLVIMGGLWFIHSLLTTGAVII
ncbi:MAG: CAP domain-containing protein [Patescibacteria group bacterium]